MWKSMQLRHLQPKAQFPRFKGGRHVHAGSRFCSEGNGARTHCSGPTSAMLSAEWNAVTNLATRKLLYAGRTRLCTPGPAWYRRYEWRGGTGKHAPLSHASVDTDRTRSILAPGAAPGLGSRVRKARGSLPRQIASLLPSQPAAQSADRLHLGGPAKGARGPSTAVFGLSSEVKPESAVPVKQPAWCRSADQQDLGGPAGALVLCQRLLEVLQLVRPSCTPAWPGARNHVLGPRSIFMGAVLQAIVHRSPRQLHARAPSQTADAAAMVRGSVRASLPILAWQSKRLQVKRYTGIAPSNCQKKQRHTGLTG